MKRIIVIVVLCMSTYSYAQRKPKIKGNKNVIEVREDLPAFHAIELNDDLEIVLRKATNEGYTLLADDNLIDVLKFSVADSTLVISSFYKITSKKKLEIVVYYNELDALTLRNGDISMKDVISADKLVVNTSGAAKLELNATADIIDINMEGNSAGDFNVASDSLNLVLKDRIDAKIYATGEKNTILMYKNASVKLEGTTDVLTAKLYGNSSLKAEKLESTEAWLVSEDSPNARINVIDDFQLSSRGSSKTSIYGNPKITILDFLDTSQLNKRSN